MNCQSENLGLSVVSVVVSVVVRTSPEITQGVLEGCEHFGGGGTKKFYISIPYTLRLL